MPRPGSEVGKLPRCPSSSLIDCMDRRCRLRRGFPRMLRTLIWPLAFTAMDDAGATAFGAWPHVESVSDVAATAIVTDHAWPQNLDSVDACEPITLESTSPQRTLRSAPPENRRGASDRTVTTLRPPLGDALTNAPTRRDAIDAVIPLTTKIADGDSAIVMDNADSSLNRRMIVPSPRDLGQAAAR